jgi:hypothetical protein
LAKRKKHIPINAIIAMSLFAFILILIGDLKVILEFGSVTFLLVSLLMAFANLKIYKQTSSFLPFILLAIGGLFIALILILYFEYKNQIEQLYFIGGIYMVLTLGAILYSWNNKS